MSNNTDHERLMKRAIELSRVAVGNGNHPFGALLAKDGKILLEAENHVDTERDCTQHAELRLVSLASRTLDREDLSRSVLYTSTEPCPMCAAAIFWAGIRTVVYGCSDDALATISGKSNFRINSREILSPESGVLVIGPVLGEEALNVHRWFAETHEYKERLA